MQKIAIPISLLPEKNAPRWRVATLLALFLFIGITFLGINKSLGQIGWMVSVALLSDIALHYLFKDKTKFFFPLSALITGLGLSILTNFAHAWWLGALPVFLAISSKYIFTYQGRHIFNPGMFGIVCCLLISDGLISPAPASQWGGNIPLLFFFVITALSLFLYNVGRSVLTLAFLGFYVVQLWLRAYVFGGTIPPSLLIDGILQSPAFYLFTYFMLTDPATSPKDRKGQLWMALAVVIFDLAYHLLEVRFSLFYAGFTYFLLRWGWLHLKAEEPALKRMKANLLPLLCVGVITASFLQIHQPPSSSLAPQFHFDEVATEITAKQGTVLQDVDPRIRHVAKWFFSLGDAVAIRDINGDGLLDIFLTMPLKASEDRAQLYLNHGDFQFKRFEIAALEPLRQHPEIHGVPMNALWFDHGNDGDQDLLIVVYGGHPWLLENQWSETGSLSFSDISEQAGLAEYFNSAAVNVLDVNHDGELDVWIGGSMSATHLGYDDGRQLNLFALPEAESDNDRQPLYVMRRNPFDSRNGGENALYLANGKSFERINNTEIGIQDEHRWTLDIGTGDVNNDGWMDIYFSNTAGPDNLYINQNGKSFAEVKGATRDAIGQDTYRGMNASFGDVDGNGQLDIYVSNMHKTEAPEGSLLWLNDGNFAMNHSGFMQDKAISRGIENRGRFGWGAAMGDLNLDGHLDIVQMNGWIDDGYDRMSETCPAYEYRMFQVEAAPPETHGYADNWPSMEGACMYPKEPKRVYLNQGKNFSDVAEFVGWEAADNAKAVALADLNNDGALDAVVTRMTGNISIYQNQPASEPEWLGLELIGNGISCNKDAVGTRVVARYLSGGKTKQQIREVTASNGLSAQGDMRVLFGFGTEKPENLEITIRWCGYDGAQVIQPEFKRYHTISQSR